MARDDKDRNVESERILDRISRETDGGSSLFARTSRKARDHVTARDSEAEDEIELWGARIGRALGLVLVVVLAGYLLLMLMGG